MPVDTTMTMLYLDTNIFIYLTDRKSQFYKPCQTLIKYCKSNNLILATSAETFQEIIYLAHNTKQLSKGILIAKNALKTVDMLLPITETTILIYLEQVETYISATSRDLIHLSVCLENKIDKIVSFDSDFKTFKGLKWLKPGDKFP